MTSASPRQRPVASAATGPGRGTPALRVSWARVAGWSPAARAGAVHGGVCRGNRLPRARGCPRSSTLEPDLGGEHSHWYENYQPHSVRGGAVVPERPRAVPLDRKKLVWTRRRGAYLTCRAGLDPRDLPAAAAVLTHHHDGAIAHAPHSRALRLDATGASSDDTYEITGRAAAQAVASPVRRGDLAHAVLAVRPEDSRPGRTAEDEVGDKKRGRQNG